MAALKKKIFRLGLALGGGGAKGFAHLGVIKALEERGIKPNIIAGTSAGAIAGAMVASGIPPEKALRILQKKDITQYSKLEWPKDGLFTLRGLRKTLIDELPSTRFEDLHTPLIVTASNLSTGQVKYFDSGDLVEPVIASSSIPILFRPVKIENAKYADGGILCNLPIHPLLKLCEQIIAVDIAPVKQSREVDNMAKVAVRTFQMSISAQMQDISKKPVILIQPKEVANFTFFDFKKSNELFSLGYKYVNQFEFPSEIANLVQS